MTTMKTLRSHTIIPQELYVERAADAQLKQIVMDMGRPGYILVARQMGKTNLLLNAKRTLGNDVDKFVYLDVSNTFSEIQQFFRNIVDVAIDSYPSTFSAPGEKIKHSRLSGGQSLPAHKEHEHELRELLRATEGRVVICLDEIDALTKTAYADLVFSLIRSIYFSGRVNSPEFERLTYVLSGVAEPAELIKNKDVSPFNIGEKIYLDDFSRDEFNRFVLKAKLTFEQDVFDRIFFWTCGNPRMSWDLCSALEDMAMESGFITVENVDHKVHEMYLTNFDRPPVDHIRTLVEADSVIRDAIMSIHYEKSETISDAVRNKLYLAGIVRPNQGGSKVITIRNPILQESLSESWIQDAERKSLSLLELADKKFSMAIFSEALPLYQEYLAAAVSPKSPEFIYSSIGRCQFKLNRYEDAIESYKKTNFTKETYPTFFYLAQYTIGLCYLLLGKYEDSSIYFRKILQQDPQADSLHYYFETCLNLSQALFIDFEKNMEEIVALNQRVIDMEKRVRTVADGEYPANRILYIAHYNLSRASRISSDIVAARKHLDRSIEIADARGQIALLLESVSLAPDRSSRRAILERCVQHVSTNRLVVSKDNKDFPLDLTLDICGRLVEYLEENDAQEELEKFIEHLEDKSLPHSSKPEEIFTHAVYASITNRNSKGAIKLINKALSLPSLSKGVDTRRTLMSLGAMLTPYNEHNLFSKNYCAEFVNASGSKLAPTDFRVIWGIVQGHIANVELLEAEKIVSRVRELVTAKRFFEHVEITAPFLDSANLILDTLELYIHNAVRTDTGEDTLKDAAVVLARLEKAHPMTLPYFNDEFLLQNRSHVKSIIASLKKVITVRRPEKKIGRNEIVTVRFLDGTIASGKFKKFEKQLFDGLCKLANDA